MRRSTLLLVVAILASAGVVWNFQQRRLGEIHAASTALAHQLAERQTLATELEQRLKESGDALAAAQRDKTSIALTTTDTVRDIDRLNSAQQFERPPSKLPSWGPGSPFVWLRKDELHHLPMRPFGEDGGLFEPVAYGLTLTPDETRALNARLKKIVRDFRASEAVHVELSDAHLPGVAGQEGTPLTVVIHPLPDEGRIAQERFTAEIHRSLGDQRSALVLGSGEEWLKSTFSQSGTQPVTISVLRRADDTYNVSVKRGSGWMNTGGIKWAGLQAYVPRHLLPRFAPLAPEPTRAGN
jgi:hypothetical protein